MLLLYIFFSYSLNVQCILLSNKFLGETEVLFLIIKDVNDWTPSFLREQVECSGIIRPLLL